MIIPISNANAYVVMCQIILSTLLQVFIKLFILQLFFAAYLNLLLSYRA